MTSALNVTEDPLETPSDIDAVLKRLLHPAVTVTAPERSVLATEDEAYLSSLVAAVRLGRRAVLIVEDADERLRYMFSNTMPAEAIAMLGKVTEATGRRLADGDI